MTPDKDFMQPEQMDADNKEFVAQMQALLSGAAKPANDTMAYLIAQYKDDAAEFEAAQRALVAAQEALLKVRAKIEVRERDLKHWHEMAAKG